MIKEFRSASSLPVVTQSPVPTTYSGGPSFLDSMLSSVFGALLVVPLLTRGLGIFRRGFWRGGFGPGRVGASLFGWGKPAAIGLALALLFSPGYIDQLLPGWRGNVGFVALACGAIALLTTMVRFCSGVISCAFWMRILAVIGRNMHSVSIDAGPAILPAAPATYQDNGEEWVDMFTERAVPLTRIAALRRLPAEPESEGFFAALNPMPRIGGYIRNVSNDISGTTDRFVGGLSRDVSSGIRSVSHAVGISEGEFGDMTAMIGLGGGGGVLPDSAYFARPYQPSGPMIPNSNGISLPPELGGIMHKLEGFLR